MTLSPEITKTLLGLAVLASANALLGALAAVKARSFDWQRLSNYLYSMLIEQAALLVLAALSTVAGGEWIALFGAGAAAVGLRLAADIKDKVAALVRAKLPVRG